MHYLLTEEKENEEGTHSYQCTMQMKNLVLFITVHVPILGSPHFHSVLACLDMCSCL
jgi:hypothetical protein